LWKLEGPVTTKEKSRKRKGKKDKENIKKSKRKEKKRFVLIIRQFILKGNRYRFQITIYSSFSSKGTIIAFR